MAARITRAKKKIAAARIPYRVPEAAELPDGSTRCSPSSTWSSRPATPRRPASELVRGDLVERALDLARMLRVLMPDEPRGRAGCSRCCCSPTPAAPPAPTPTAGCCCSRTRTGRCGTAARSPRATALVVAALHGGAAGRFALQAAIAACTPQAPTYDETDWRADRRRSTTRCCAIWPSPVVALNRAVALAMVAGRRRPGRARRLEADGRLAGYRYLPARRPTCCGASAAAEAAGGYREALELADNEAERAFLARPPGRVCGGSALACGRVSFVFTAAHRGGSGPPLVRLHGFTDTWRTWELVLPVARAPARRARADARRPRRRPAARAARSTATRSPTRSSGRWTKAGFETAHLAGNSLGGYVALQLAARGRARSVVAFAPAGGWARGDESFAETLEFFARCRISCEAAAPHADAIVATPEGRRRATGTSPTTSSTSRAELLAHQIRGAAACTPGVPLIGTPRARAGPRRRADRAAPCGSSGAPRTGCCPGRRPPRASATTGCPTPTGSSSTASATARSSTSRSRPPS